MLPSLHCARQSPAQLCVSKTSCPRAYLPLWKAGIRTSIFRVEGALIQPASTAVWHRAEEGCYCCFWISCFWISFWIRGRGGRNELAERREITGKGGLPPRLPCAHTEPHGGTEASGASRARQSPCNELGHSQDAANSSPACIPTPTPQRLEGRGGS